MEYICKVVNIEHDDVLIIKIHDAIITGFVNTGVMVSIGDDCRIDLQIFDIAGIELSEKKKSINRKGKSLSQTIVGVLDIYNSTIHSIIDFVINKEFLYDYSYLHGKNVEIDVIRIDFTLQI